MTRRRHAHGCLLSRRTSSLIGQYQTILLGDRSTCVCCPKTRLAGLQPGTSWSQVSQRSESDPVIEHYWIFRSHCMGPDLTRPDTGIRYGNILHQEIKPDPTIDHSWIIGSHCTWPDLTHPTRRSDPDRVGSDLRHTSWPDPTRTGYSWLRNPTCPTWNRRHGYSTGKFQTTRPNPT